MSPIRSLEHRLASSQPMPIRDQRLATGDAGFQNETEGEGISIGLSGTPCDDKEPICPIFGTVWYDDFNLQRLGSSGPAEEGGSSNRR